MTDQVGAMSENRKRWLANGTFERIDEAIKNRTLVNIKRSSGDMVTGYIAANGHGGMSVGLVWGPGAADWYLDGGYIRVDSDVMSKTVPTEDFLAWNPAIAGEP